MSVGSQAVRSHAKFQRDEANLLMLDLLNDNEDYVMAIERYSCSVVSIIGWGRRIDRKNDYVVQQALMIMDQGVNMQVPGAYWAENHSRTSISSRMAISTPLIVGYRCHCEQEVLLRFDCRRRSSESTKFRQVSHRSAEGTWINE